MMTGRSTRSALNLGKHLHIVRAGRHVSKVPEVAFSITSSAIARGIGGIVGLSAVLWGVLRGSLRGWSADSSASRAKKCFATWGGVTTWGGVNWLSHLVRRLGPRAQYLAYAGRNGSGLITSEDVLLDDRVDAPVAVNHLGDAEVDADCDKRDCLILR